MEYKIEYGLSEKNSCLVFYDIESGFPLIWINGDSFEITEEGIKFDKDVSKYIKEVLC